MLRSRRDGDREQGQIIVLFAMVLVVILAFGAIVVDLGVLRNNRQTLVNTFDAAALAGGSVLPVDGSVSGAATAANNLIVQNIATNYPGLALGTNYTIQYKCLIGVTIGGQPRLSDVPLACNPAPSLGRAPVVGDFPGAGPTRVSSCNPLLGDKCNVVVIAGSATTPFSLGPVVGVPRGSTGLVVSAACNGPCGSSLETPVDVVLILDRTLSMSAADIADLQVGADAVLSVFNPAIQRVALGAIGPSRVAGTPSAPSLTACPSGSTSPVKRLASPNNQVYGVAMSNSSDVNYFNTGALPGTRGDVPRWITVGFSGTDTETPAVTSGWGFNEAFSNNGVTNTGSRIWKAISCFYSYTTGTNLDTPVAMAQRYLTTFGRPGVKKGIIIETDGTPQAGDGSAHYTCNASNNTATAAKNAGIEIFTIGFGIGSATCPSRTSSNSCSNPRQTNSNESAAWSCDPVSSLLSSMASPDDPNDPQSQHFFDAPDSATLIEAFRQAAVTLATGKSRLIQLYPTPIVTAVSPSAGTRTGGTPVTITGKFFTGASSVQFGGTSVTFAVTSDTTITTTAPAGTLGQVVDIIVTTPGGTSTIMRPDDQYTYTN